MSPAAIRIRDCETTVFARYGFVPKEHTVSLVQPQVDVRVLEFGAGNGKTPVLLLHGIASVTALAAPLRPEYGPSVREHAVAVLRGLCDALEIRRADLVGHSMGGQFSLYFALDAADRVRRVVTLGAPGAGFAEVRPAPVMCALSVPLLGPALLRLPLPRTAYRRSNENLLGRGALDGWPQEFTEVGHLAARRPGFAPSVASLFRGLITPARVRPGIPVGHAELATIAQPVLLLWGDDDLFLTPDRAQPSIDAIPHGTLTRMPGGHAPWLDSPEVCGDALTEFLNAP
ncbi:alpha/beta fold hydrolase [Streptomyces sp. NPDC051218]|uniref:alpha/beta fold hydrolase n=1 Tax=Streptomyces sp. NPDC051218 TaxID=3365645 RepID=UPI0037B7AB67